MILVTGATGNLGNLTVDFLLKKTKTDNVVVLARDGEKAKALQQQKRVEARIADYDDYAALVKAFKGIDTLLLVSTMAMENRFQQHVNAITAAKENNVKHIVYTSLINASAEAKFLPGVDHFKTEEYLKQSGINFTIFRNTFYSEVAFHFLGDALQTGNWYYPAGNSKANFASRVDMAEAISNVLMDPSSHKNKTYEISTNPSYTFKEIADIVSEVSRKQITYIPIALDDMKKGMTGAGVPEQFVNLAASAVEAITTNQLISSDNTLENLLKKKPITLKETIQQLLAANA